MKLTDEGVGHSTQFPGSNGWRIPSSGCLSSFRSRLGINESNYSSYGLSDKYWSSTTRTETRQNLVAGLITYTYTSYISLITGEVKETAGGTMATRWMCGF